MINLVFILMLMLSIDPRKGIAMAYTHTEDLMNAGWYYIWDSCLAYRCVPMSYSGEDPNLPKNYDDYILLFNEPNITPISAVNIYMSLTNLYPNAKWVVGNTIFWGSWQTWQKDFKNICVVTQDCIVPKYWGVHVYIRQGQYSTQTWTQYIDYNLDSLHNYLGGKFWVTEFADVSGKIAMDNALLNYFKSESYIERWAYFTNRATQNETWYPSDWGSVQLFDWDGKMTQIGNWYAFEKLFSYLPFVRN